MMTLGQGAGKSGKEMETGTQARDDQGGCRSADSGRATAA